MCRRLEAGSSLNNQPYPGFRYAPFWAKGDAALRARSFLVRTISQPMLFDLVNRRREIAISQLTIRSGRCTAGTITSLRQSKTPPDCHPERSLRMGFATCAFAGRADAQSKDLRFLDIALR